MAQNERIGLVKHIHIIQGIFLITVSRIKWILNNMRFFCC